jgi:hypothetical protein
VHFYNCDRAECEKINMAPKICENESDMVYCLVIKMIQVRRNNVLILVDSPTFSSYMIYNINIYTVLTFLTVLSYAFLSFFC